MPCYRADHNVLIIVATHKYTVYVSVTRPCKQVFLFSFASTCPNHVPLTPCNQLNVAPAPATHSTAPLIFQHTVSTDRMMPSSGK
jgi:hypothetical protein